MAHSSPRLTVIVAGAMALLLAVALHLTPASFAQDAGDERAQGVPGTGFTYQGYLEDEGEAATGDYDFRFRLYDADSGGNQVGITVTLDAVPVTDGLFTVLLDFGPNLFGGAPRWLELAVRPGGSADPYTILDPRQPLTPAPQALSLPNVYSDPTVPFVGVGRDFPLTGNEAFGVRYEGEAGDYGGMYVETSDSGGWPFYGYATAGDYRAWHYLNGSSGEWILYNDGPRLAVPDTGGLVISDTTSHGLRIGTTGSDGIRIGEAADDGIQVGSDPDYPNYGLYIPSPGVSTYGLWPNTANASGEWALFTVDKIEASNVTFGALSLLARVSGSEGLMPGDVVAVAGVADALPGGHTPLPLVHKASSPQATAVIGVVENRMVLEPAPGKSEMGLHSADGPALEGDYVSLVVLGVAEVKVDPTSEIAVGDRLTSSGVAGQARPLQSRTLEGMVITEGAQSIGIALEPSVSGQETVAVFVTLR